MKISKKKRERERDRGNERQRIDEDDEHGSFLHAGSKLWFVIMVLFVCGCRHTCIRKRHVILNYTTLFLLQSIINKKILKCKWLIQKWKELSKTCFT